MVYEDHIDVKLKADVDAILNVENSKKAKKAVNFEQGSKVILSDGGRITTLFRNEELKPDTTKFRLKTRNQSEKLFTVNVISSGDAFVMYNDNVNSKGFLRKGGENHVDLISGHHYPTMK